MVLALSVEQLAAGTRLCALPVTVQVAELMVDVIPCSKLMTREVQIVGQNQVKDKSG